MLFFRKNQIESTSTASAAGVCTIWRASGRNFLFRPNAKILLYAWMTSFTFLVRHHLLKTYTVQESKRIKFGKDLASQKIFAFENNELKKKQFSRQTHHKLQLLYHSFYLSFARLVCTARPA